MGRVCSKEFIKSMTSADFVSANLNPDNLVGVLREFHVLVSYYGGLAVASISHVCDEYFDLVLNSERLKDTASQIPSKNHLVAPRLVATELFEKDQSLYKLLVSMKQRKDLGEILDRQKKVFQ
ncbi:MAG: hypothetical protein Q7K43_04155 [Candidatus Woesearchaeota archaeon]|nr:hypothetical protein [Candidatus Woesearchaeota archaeon]